MRDCGILSVSSVLPKNVRTNDFYRRRYPELVADMERRTLARLFSAAHAEHELNAFDRAMSPYLDDPFRGTVERRVLDPFEPVLPLELAASREAIAHAGITPGDVDLAWVGSFLPDTLGVGNGAFLARQLELPCPAYNIESACATALAAIDDACLRVATGRSDHVLVTVSCSYSRYLDENDTLGWFMGDAAGAFVIGPTEPGRGAKLLALHSVNTVETCDTFRYDLEHDASGARLVLRCSPRTGRILRDTSERFVRECAEGACAKAGLSMADVDMFVLNTPTAWFAPFAADVLGISRSRTFSVYERIGNAGPALLPVNLHAALAMRSIPNGARVLLYSIGSVSSAAAAIWEWGRVGFGVAGLAS
jgi:3-oxoacyl-[acyl-carrier-protein] synthase-3